MKKDRTVSNLFKFVVISPIVIWLSILFVLPMSLMFFYSFGENVTGVDIAITGTLENYIRIFDGVYMGIFAKSLVMASITTFICLVIGFIVAISISSASPKMQNIFILLIMLPFWTNMLIRTYALIAMLRTRGFVNDGLFWLWEKTNGILNFIGLGRVKFLGDKFEPLQLLYNNAVIIGFVYTYLPFMILPLFASLNKLDKSYLEASYDLGAGHLRTIFCL